LGGEVIEVVQEIKCLGMVLDRKEKWGKRKQVIAMEKTGLNDVNICVARASKFEVRITEQLCKSILESRILDDRFGNLEVGRWLERNREVIL
jgi:hypothetical protein